jgi:hypothetical protein
VAAQLAAWGSAPGTDDRAQRRIARPVEKDLETVLVDLAAEFPALSPLVDRRYLAERGRGVMRGALIVLVATVVTGAVLVVGRRHRRPAWLLPGLVGAMLSGVSVAAALSVWDLVRIVQSVQMSGSGGLAAFGQGLWDANHTWLLGLQVSLLATIAVGVKYLLPPRGTATEPWAPRPLAFAFALVPLAGVAIAFVIFFATGQRLIAIGFEPVAPASSTHALVAASAWTVAAGGGAAASFCVLNLMLFPAFRTAGAAAAGVQRASAAFLATTALFVVVALTMVIAFNRQMSALAGTF